MPEGSTTATRKKTGKEEDTIQRGSHYMVLRKNNEWSKGVVMQRRINKNTSQTEYYVHFETLDKRLDEWVTVPRIRLNIGDVQMDNPNKSSKPSTSGLQSAVLNREAIPSTSANAGPSNSLYIPDSPDKVEKEHQEITKIKYINMIQIGIYEIDTWYYSPYPGHFGMQDKLFICEYCLKYMVSEKTFRYHLNRCNLISPPGDLIYEKDNVLLYEIDPITQRLYCQLLSLLAKLFIDHKTVLYDVEQFLFYALCERDSEGIHLRGYFSKEKGCPDGFNVNCILILPPFQRQGYGKLLIGLSYELSKIEGICGSPEKPLSDLGKLSYLSYWSWVLLEKLNSSTGMVTMKQLCQQTGFTWTDISTTLQYLNLLKYYADDDTFVIPPEAVHELLNSGAIKKPRLIVDSACVNWTPKYFKRV